MLKDQKELLELFNVHGVEYMVIGGHAVGAHAEPRLTKDLDLLVRNTPENSVGVFDIWTRVVRREIVPGLETDFIGLDDLIANKLAVGRPQDAADVAKLQEIKRLD